MPLDLWSAALAVLVGLVLGLLGGGGSILALPVFLYVLHVPPKPARAMSLAVVAVTACIAFLSHWRRGNVAIRIALPFGVAASIAAFATARWLSPFVSDDVQLNLFTAFALVASYFMLRGSAAATAPPEGETRFAPVLAVQAAGVGALTALVGAGGGFLIVPALIVLARVTPRIAVGSSLLIIAMNAASALLGYAGTVPLDIPLLAWFTTLATMGALMGTAWAGRVPQQRLRQGFGVMILILCVVRIWTQLR